MSANHEKVLYVRVPEFRWFELHSHMAYQSQSLVARLFWGWNTDLNDVPSEF